MADDSLPAPSPDPLEKWQRATQLWVQRLRGVTAHGDAERTRLELKGLSLALAGQWRAEEGWMDAEGYPGTAEHQLLHQRLLRLFAGVVRTQDPDAIHDFARSFDEHVRHADLKLGRFLVARNNLRRLGDALPGERPALVPVPLATPEPGVDLKSSQAPSHGPTPPPPPKR